MTSRAEVRARLIALLEEIGGFSPEQVTDRATLDNELQMQSVAFVELQVALEDEYGIVLDPIAIAELNEFGAILDYLYHAIESREST